MFYTHTCGTSQWDPPPLLPALKKKKKLLKGGKAAATFFATMTASTFGDADAAKDVQRMIGEVEGVHGDKGDYHAKNSGMAGRTAGVATRHLYNTTGMQHFTNAPVRSRIHTLLITLPSFLLSFLRSFLSISFAFLNIPYPLLLGSRDHCRGRCQQ